MVHQACVAPSKNPSPDAASRGSGALEFGATGVYHRQTETVPEGVPKAHYAVYQEFSFRAAFWREAALPLQELSVSLPLLAAVP